MQSDNNDETPPGGPAVFFGHVHPISGRWYIEEVIGIPFPGGDEWAITIRNSHIGVHVSDVPADLDQFLNEVRSIVQGCLDSLGFHLGAALTAELVAGFIAPNRFVGMSAHSWPEVRGPKANAPLHVSGSELSPWVQASVSEPLLRLALADLRSAIQWPDDTAFYSYRCVESIKQWFVPLGAKPRDDEMWAALRSELRVEEEDLRRLAQAASQRRHGAQVPITAEERLWAIQLARDVLNRFVDYLGHQGPVPSPPATEAGTPPLISTPDT